MAIEATYESTCQQCGSRIDCGDEIEKDETIDAWVHVDCVAVVGGSDEVFIVQDAAGFIKAVFSSEEQAEKKCRGHDWKFKKFSVE